MAEISSTFKFVFPDEQTRDTFEVEFKGWMKEWQQQQAVYRMLAATQPAEVTAGTGTTSAPATDPPATPEAHHYDGTEPEAHLLTIGASTITLANGTTISTSGIYLDICPFF
jgi:hypothetical protein